MHMTIGWIFATVLSIGWGLLIFTSASLLLPNPQAAWDRLCYGLNIFSATSLWNLHLRLRVLSHLAVTYLVTVPASAYLWTIDEICFGSYTHIKIHKPLITISVPRGGTTSFHRTLALDDRFATPSMLELVVPFICVYKLVVAVRYIAPDLIQKLEFFLKYINRVTPAVEARHPISLFAPDADDILLGEWHWVGVGAVRTFPVAKYWQKHYQMNAHSSQQRKRSLQLHHRMCQKVLYNTQSNNQQPRRLLLRSHLSPCVEDFQQLYPDAVLVGILRDPIDVLRSFAGLSTEAVLAATGVNMMAHPGKDNDNCIRWPSLFRTILSDMMDRESALYCGSSLKGTNTTDESKKNVWNGRCQYVTFEGFKARPIESLKNLYSKIDMPTTKQFLGAVHDGLGRHETYKMRHSYKNPTLEDMNIDREQFLNLPGVQRYVELLQKGDR